MQSRSGDALRLASHSKSLAVPQTEARKQAITWLGRELGRSAIPLPAPPESATPVAESKPKSLAASSRLQVAARRPGKPMATSMQATSRTKALREAYEALGVHRDISDSDLDRVYAALLHSRNPDNNPHKCAGYYTRKTKELRASYTCIRSNRGASTAGEPVVGSAVVDPAAVAQGGGGR